MNDKITGRFVKGNGAHRRRQLRERARGIATLNPKHVPSWMSPHVAAGVSMLGELVQRYPDDAGLRGVIGATVDAWTVYRTLLTLGAAGDPAALKESRAWLREYRSLTITLSALAGELSAHRDGDMNPHEALNAALAEGRSDK
jgi:hypothetical protein